MKDLAGKVAVVTGSASGMGFAFANRFAEEGMSVVLADIEAEPLAMAEAAIKARGARVLAVRTNVLQDGDVEKLADAAFRTFGNVHVVCNNAGVSGTSGKPVWEAPQEDWDWVFGVNFWGVAGHPRLRPAHDRQRRRRPHREHRIRRGIAHRSRPVLRLQARCGLPHRGALQELQNAEPQTLRIGPLPRLG